MKKELLKLGNLDIFEAYKGMYDCRRLPRYARFLIDHQLENYAKQQLAFSRQLKLPLLTSLSARFSDEELLKIAIDGSREYLEFLAANKAYEQLVASMNKWLKDQLEIVGKMDIVAEDITLVNFIRAQAMKKLIPLYTADIDVAIEIALEIDTIILGGITTAVDVYIDILKEKIAEQSNLASKLIEASPAVTFLFDTKKHRQSFVSGNVVEVLGYYPEEIQQMGDRFVLDLTHPDDLPLVLNHLQQVAAENSNKTQQVEFRLKHKDGSYRWLRTYDVIFRRDEENRPLEILAKTFEITREKETAIALIKSEKQLLEAQSIAHIGSYEWNLRDKQSTNTPEVYRIFELTTDQPYEQFLSHVHPEDVQKVKEAIAESFVSGLYDCEYRYAKNGKEKVIWSVGRVEFRDNAPYRMVGTVQDVTEIKKIEKELLQKSDELAHTNESLRQFAYVASHDMKEPLRKIMMFTDLVLNAEKNNISPRSVGHLQKMQASGRNLYRMVEDILSFSLLEAKEKKQRVSLDSILDEVLELLEEIINHKQAKIVRDSLPHAWVIPSQFRQLFQNLISNSLKFSRADEPPEIRITAKITPEPELETPEQADAYLEICIEDNGIGFPEDASEKIFELFSRIHPKSKYEGTGLGLSISRRIADNHGGIIRATPKKDFGAAFHIVVPQPAA